MLLLAETLEFINPLKLHNREFKMLWFEISSERVGRAEFDLRACDMAFMLPPLPSIHNFDMLSLCTCAHRKQRHLEVLLGGGVV